MLALNRQMKTGDIVPVRSGSARGQPDQVLPARPAAVMPDQAGLTAPNRLPAGNPDPSRGSALAFRVWSQGLAAAGAVKLLPGTRQFHVDRAGQSIQGLIGTCDPTAVAQRSPRDALARLSKLAGDVPGPAGLRLCGRRARTSDPVATPRLLQQTARASPGARS
jgi:hypothetical protein